MDTLMDNLFPQRATKIPLVEGFLLRPMPQCLSFCIPNKTRECPNLSGEDISIITSTSRQHRLAWGAWAGSLTKPRRAEVACQRPLTPWIERLLQRSQRSSAKKSFMWSGADTLVHAVFVPSDWKTWSCCSRWKNWLWFLFYYQEYRTDLFIWGLHQWKLPGEKVVCWLRCNRIFLLHVNWPESVILAHVWRD